ncbi:MAG: class I poly(R)-hydroxyalkanoic acid synthase [Limimaricola sp.]|uniref:PHA/PHB synthase family protein n=1 Tax=Limimaricola sp. TaxID=2211665 RepID=UPI001DF2963E|nr:class I poly(R)-hydroxyalkanoic acid synthase [Limimaricola sp.]MBI1416522.1 class I poly(R)-hydroxyalkanoic acid synthase [Limimaricola sp.]
MTTSEFDGPAPDGKSLTKLEENMAELERLNARLVSVLSRKKPAPPALEGPSPMLYAKAAAAYMEEWATNPARLIEHQTQYWGKAMAHFAAAQAQLARGLLTPPEDETPPDRRFTNPLWQTNPYFNFIKQQFLINAEAVRKAISDMEGLDERERKRLFYFGEQIIDMFSPTNFLATNPDALTRALETDGQSLVDGLKNLIADLEANDGDLVVSLSDKNAFKVGGNLATTPGEVVFRNRMFELIQYAPTTEKVHKTPLIIFPPWINKFYILDLKAQNSLIKWIVDQGFTLFVVSWVNPGPEYSDVGMADYIEEGYLTAIAQAREICGVKKVNVVGYCIAGTTLSLTLSLMKQRGDKSINAATFFTTLTDFSDQGEVGVFLDNDFVDGIEAEVNARGVLRSYFMSRTFSFLRSNDLLYAPAIRNYMLGQTPPAFDLLYWNGDGTNLPAKMAVEYLRGLCQANRFATDGFDLAGTTLHLSEVDVPLCAIACETDHIAPWMASYAGIQQMGSAEKMFILSGSGHIAGIVNPPSKVKYGHWTNPDLTLSAADWKAGAEAHEGSWWPLWGNWLAQRSGPMVEAREPGDSRHPPLAPAPGTYVTSVPES